MQSGVNHYFNLLTLDPNIFKVYYEFGSLASISGADPLYSGILSSVGDFFHREGSGYFTGQHVQISHETGLFAPNWTMFFVYEREEGGVLFSSYHQDGNISGFVIGINEANKLYLETWTPKGPAVLEPDLALGTKNIIAVTKAGNSAAFHLFDVNSQKVYSESFSIPSSYINNSTGWCLGNAVNPPGYFSGKPFKGYMESFLYFNTALMPYQLSRMFSGFVVGRESEYLHSFGFDGVAYLRAVDDRDFSEVYLYPSGLNKLNSNIPAVYNRSLREFVLQSPQTPNSVSVYANGVLQFEKSGTFFVSGLQTSSDNYFDSEDDFCYDVNPTGVFVRQEIATPRANTPINLPRPSYHNIYLNGVKLVKGVDYTEDVDSISIEDHVNNTTGFIQIVPTDSFDEYVHFLGVFKSKIHESPFPRNSSQLWLNGLRQHLGLDYIEISKTDLLVSGANNPLSNLTLFNNETTYWQ